MNTQSQPYCTGPLRDPFSQPTRFLFFAGKGGVGKISLACATAVAFVPWHPKEPVGPVSLAGLFRSLATTKQEIR